MHLSDKARLAFQQHAIQQYPKEACGVLVSGEFIPTVNVADDPTANFRIAPTQIISIETGVGPIEAVLHTHPYDAKADRGKHDPRWPSTSDMTSWLKGRVPWGIASCDGEGISQVCWLDEDNPEPLVGREFIHGINDCYSVVRDWFRLERGIVLPNYARGMEWWDRGLDLYSQNFRDAGFVEINITDATVGDVCLFQVMSPVINHAAVITGPNEILHHLFHRLSGYDRLDRWHGQIRKWVRYVGDKQC